MEAVGGRAVPSIVTPSPRTESLIAAAVRWAERIKREIDNVFEG